MARYLFPSVSDLWRAHETLYVNIFIAALQRLSDKNVDTSSDENAISRRLRIILNTVCHEEGKRTHCEIPAPDLELPIQPVNENELRRSPSGKRPDFTCNRVDPDAVGPDEHEIPFHIECKKLGVPTSESWILNRNYVTDGVKRFDSMEHRYGERAPSGMMIGYIVSMSPGDVLNEVRVHCGQLMYNSGAIQFELSCREVRQYKQVLNRININPATFKLIHLWVDLSP